MLQEVKELQDQVRDVMFYLDTQKKVDGSTEKQVPFYHKVWL